MPPSTHNANRADRASWPLLLLAAIAALWIGHVTSGGAAVGTCQYRGLLPDSRCTSGAVFASVGPSQICRRGYARSVRNVPYALKRVVYADYGIRRHPARAFEVDHLIPLELGGSNVLANLWPEPAPGYHQKDRLENRLHELVCGGRLSLGTAQRAIAADWRTAFARYVGGGG